MLSIFKFLLIFLFLSAFGIILLKRGAVVIVKILLIFISIFIYKLISNFYYLKRCKSLQNGYFEWIKSTNADYTSYRREVLNLFKKANVTDAYIPTAQPIGFMQISTFKASVQQNFPSLITDHVSATMTMFDESIGVYRLRIKECFNPIYWIDCVIFLPKNILTYLNLDSEKVAFKILNVIFSSIWWLIIASITIFDIDFKNLITKYIELIP